MCVAINYNKSSRSLCFNRLCCPEDGCYLPKLLPDSVVRVLRIIRSIIDELQRTCELQPVEAEEKGGKNKFGEFLFCFEVLNTLYINELLAFQKTFLLIYIKKSKDDVFLRLQTTRTKH